MHWIIGIFMGFMALLSHQTATTTVSTPIPVIIQAPKGVVMGASATEKSMIQAAVGSAPEKVSGQDESDASYRPATTTSFVNPNASFMEVSGPAGTPVVQPYVAPADTRLPNGDIDGNIYSTGGYSQ